MLIRVWSKTRTCFHAIEEPIFTACCNRISHQYYKQFDVQWQVTNSVNAKI